MTTATSEKSREHSSSQCEYLRLVFSPLNTPLHARWRNNGLSADFLGDYVMTFLPTGGGSHDAAQSWRKQVKHAITYIANELLENAMKYHEREVDIPIGLQLELAPDRITVSATNGIGSGQAQIYKNFVSQILQEDAADLIVRQVEQSSLDNSACSSVGLLTMISDYGAELDWQFAAHPAFDQMLTVTTSAVLPLKNFSGVLS